ncbi:MAG: choice-of-anchor L domain-containing protein [Flavobacterium sp.]|uniref:choice-of-anchor L domain-containing protein n=3 Tax=Flavobacterium sp. TaxID=239 RepID=UPI0035282AF9
MKQKLLYLLFFFGLFQALAQPITVNTTTYTVPQLVQDVLFGNGAAGSSCVGTLNNITWSTGTNFSGGNPNGIGYFQNTNPTFPLTNGVILSTGNVAAAPGPNTNTQSNGTNAWTGDAQLFNYITALGIDPNLTSYNNATVLEFDFTPYTNQMSFDFLFASEEYGTFQCSYSDAFAFFLTNVTAGTPATNLALIPSTTTPVSVVTIRDDANNNGCTSENPEFFGNYNGGGNAATAATNFNGETIVMTASSAVIPGNTYHIKLVIADRNDTQYDSAVFLGGGSFNIGSPDLAGTGIYDGIDNLTIADGTALCGNTSINIEAGSVTIPGGTYEWFFNTNPIPGATSNSYTVSEAGDYGLIITYPGGCQQTDTMTVEYYPPLSIGTPSDMVQCAAPFDLTTQQSLILNGVSSTIYYYHSEADALIYNNPITNLTNYNGTNGEEIFVAVEDENYGCLTITSFNLILDSSLCLPPTPSTPPNLTVCETSTGLGQFDFTSQIPIVLGSYNSSQYVVTFYESLINANGNIAPINPIDSYLGFGGQIIYVRLEALSNGFYGTTSFQLNVIPLPTATITGDAIVCQGSPSRTITFTGANGVAPYTFTYLDANGASQTLTTTAGNSATITVPTTTPGTFAYQLQSVSSTTTPVCSQPQTGTATVTVNPMPTATISGTQAVCLNSTPEPVITLTGANGITPYTFVYSINSVPQPPITSVGATATINAPTTATGTFDYELISVSSASTPACSQPQTGIATITVNIAPVINMPTAYEVCDDNNDGFSCLFDLATKTAEISTDPTVVITYHETPTDAQTGANSITTSTYCNIDPGTQTIYVRANFIGSTLCYATTTLQLIVNPKPLPNPVISDYSLCDYTNPGDLQEVFTLNTKTAEIANGQVGVTVSYYLTQADAQSQTSPLPNSYTNISNPQQIWINIRNITTGCNSVGSFNLIVNPLPATAVPLPIFECSNGAVTTATFNLTVNEGVTTAGATGVVVTYYTTLADAQAPTNAIATPTTYLGNDNQTIYIRVENSLTGCYSTTTQLLRVTQGPVANTPLPLQYCDPNNDGFGIFDLDSKINEIAGGSLPAGVTVSFHETTTDALLGANPLVSPYTNINPWTQTIYVKVFYTTTGCSNYVNLQLIVNPTPEATVPADLHECDYTGAVGYEPFDLTQAIPGTLGSIDPSTHTVTFYTSLADAQAGTANITNVASYINGVIDQETIYVRVETTATGCFDIVDFDIIVDPLPMSIQPNYPQYSVCDNDQSNIGFEVFDLQSQVANILLGQTGMNVTFYPSLTDAQNDTNAITTPSYQNTIIYVQTLGIRITNTTTGCYVISTMDIRVEPLPTPIPPTQPYTVCDDDQDGFAQFDLATLTTDILQGATYTLTFHETLTNAQTGDNPLPMLYTNINPFVQIIYVRAEDPVTGCIGITMVELNVNPSPIAITNVPNIEVCDTDSNTQNGQTIVNLTQQTPLILAQQPLPASAYTVTYYTSQALAEAGTSPIINTTSYNATNNQTIWVRIENIATGCYNIGSFQVIVGAPLVVATPLPINKCDDDAMPNNQYTNFDLTVRQITALAGHTIKYYPSLANAQAGTNEITDPTSYTNILPAVQTLGVVITTPQGCESITTLNIRVLPVPEPQTNPTTLPQVCENATGSGQATVDLTTNASYIINGDPNVVLHYFPSLSDLENNTNEILTPATALVGDPSIAGTTINQVQYVYIAVSSTQNFDYTNRACYVVVPQGYIVNPLPVVDLVGTSNTYQICEADAVMNNGFEEFDLTSQTADLLEGNLTTPTSTYSVAFYLDAAATQLVPNPSAYTNISNPQPIYVVITNTITGCTSDIGTFNIEVNPKPIIAYTMLDYKHCDDVDGINDGMMFYEENPLGLANYIDDILGTTQAPADYTVTFYTNQADAEAGISSNAIQDLANYQVSTGTYWIRVTNNATGCYQIDSFDVIIEKLAEPNITSNTGSNIACVNWDETIVRNNLILDSNVTTPGYNFQWLAGGVAIPGATGATYEVTNIDQDQIVYTVKVTSTSALACETTSPIFTVVRSGTAANLTYTVTNAFSDLQTIIVTNDGYGIYQYSLDDGPILDNGGIFTNVSMGLHTVHVWDVRDVNGYSCGVEDIEDVQIIDYPHYFTPNGDGIHDTWNIAGLGDYANTTKIYIFDRQGKLLKQISPMSLGWDGTFNGKLMPASDYWFRVDYLEQGVMKQFRAHFALKR